jgi:glutathione peroxidase
MELIHQFSVKNSKKEQVSLEQYKGKVLLVVNVASKCGFTTQYEGLQKLYEKYQNQGLEILAFPCNQFGFQEPGTEDEITSFCSLNYGVKFPVFAKVEVNGDLAEPLFQFLKKNQKGILNTEAIKWNFTKFLVDRHGNVIDRFSPQTKPSELEDVIEKLLKF